MVEDNEKNTTEETEVFEDEPEVVVKEPQKKPKVVKETQAPKQQSVEHKDEQHDDQSQDLKYENIQRRKENRELKRQLADLQESFNSARAEFEETKKMQQDRIVRSTLLSCLNNAGCLDTEEALMLLTNEVKFDKNGDVINDTDLVDKLKAKKAHWFTGPATTHHERAPRPAVQSANLVATLTKEQKLQGLRDKGIRF